MYKTKYFKIEELVPKKIHELIKNEDVKFKMFDENCLKFLDFCRERYGSLIVNDYIFGGKNQFRGLRTSEYENYNINSMHSKGCAFDFIPTKISVDEIFDDLRKNKKNISLVSRVEYFEGISWIHFDTKKTNKYELYFFKP